MEESVKKVYEFSVSETTTESYDDFDGLVDHVIDPFDGEEPLNLQDNAVKLEKGQEAVFKVTVTTTVELIDVRASERIHSLNLLRPPLTEHADGCGFFYGNGCGCGFAVASQASIAGLPLEAEDEPIPTTQTPPRPETPCHLDWGPSRCGLSHKQLVESPCTWTSDPRLVTCPDCLKALQPKSDEPPKYKWWCSVCGRIEAIPGLKAEHEGRIGSCVTCTNNIAAPQRSTMRVRQSPS